MCASDFIMSNNNTSTTTRGRHSNGISSSSSSRSGSSNNVIGVSRLRQSSKQQQEHEQPTAQLRERRSQSLTRFVSNNIVGSSSDRGGGASRRRSFQQQQQSQSQVVEEVPLQEKNNHLSIRQRSSSLSSFHTAVSTELLNEPGWFSHAFHGSGACTCSLLVGSHHLEDHGHHDNSNPDPANATDRDDNFDAQQDEGNDDNGYKGNIMKNGSSDHDDVDDGSNNNRDDSTECVRTDQEENDIANESSVDVRMDGKETNGCIGGDNNVEDVELDCNSKSNNNLDVELNSGATCNGIKIIKLQHLSTISRDSIGCHTEESNGNRHQNRIVHDLQEGVNQHPTTSFSDEPSLLSSSPSSSSSSLFYASNNHRNNNFINDELITKVGDLAEENGVLVDKCKKLEEELMAIKTTAPTQKELLDENKAMLFMAAISTTMIESFRVGNENLRKLSSFLSTSINNQGSSTIDQLTASIKDQGEYNRESIAATASHKMNPITEMNQEEVLEIIQDVQAENDALHKSMKESMQSVIRKSRDHMADMVETHKSTVEEYTSQVNDLRQELAAATSARDVLASEMITLKNELINMTSQLEEAVSVVATEYGVKITTLTEKLDESTSSKQELSSELESLRKENHKLTIELEEARSLVVFSVHDEMKQEQLSKNSRHSENEELVVEMERLKNENGKLNESVKEMKLLVSTLVNKLSEESASLKVAQESYEQQEEELNVEKMANTYLREEIESISTEREEAYDACKVLQQEINLLRQKCAKMIDERFDGDDSIPSSVDNSNQDKLSELSNMNESLTKELDKKNEALQAVQTVLTSLKEEQSVIKKTITELRTENAELRDRAKKSASPSPSVPPPPPKSTLKHKTSLDSSSDSSTQSQILQLEVRLRKVEKENKGLREANNIMSTKLFDEMEKTESLKIANEGLGARICKLVKFIQQNSGGVSSGSCGGEGSASSISIPGKSR